MAVAARVPQTLTEEQAESAVLALVVERGLPPSEAVDEVLSEVALDVEALHSLARTGLIERVNTKRHNDMRSGVSYKTFQRFQPKWGHGRDLASALAEMQEGADGGMKPLWEFTLADCRHLEVVCRQQARGWRNRAVVLRDASALLAKHGVDTIGSLPKNAQDKLEAAVAEAWRA